MKNLTPALILEKNKLTTPNPWLTLLDVNFDPPLYLVRNTENITFDSREYTKFPFELDVIKESSDGMIPTFGLRVSNVTRVLQGFVEALDGAVGTTIVIRWVNAAYLAENYADLTMTVEVLSATSNAQWITFTLGAPNPLRADFPPRRFLATHCDWIKENSSGDATSGFKGVECGYAGAETTCDGTLARCRELNNSARFGGFPGLAGGGVRLA